VHLLEKLRPIGADRIGQHDPLRRQQPLDPVHVRRPRCDQPFALPVLTFGILFVGSRDANHAAHLSLASGVGHQDSNQGLCVKTVGLGPTCASADMNAGRIDHVVANPLFCQQAMEPEAVAASFVATGDPDCCPARTGRPYPQAFDQRK
jgi:hypothetical protein